MKREIPRVVPFLLILLACLLLGACAILRHARFGSLPTGDRQTRIESSSRYVGGVFVNQEPTPIVLERHPSEVWKFLFGKDERNAPSTALPSEKTDLASLSPERDALIWFGHSSFYVNLGSKRILVDPVFSAYAAPFSFLNKAFPGTNVYSAEDMPRIDYVLLTHDHWDHLDYPTMVILRENVELVICPLGVGAHLERWGFAPEQIAEADWYDEMRLDTTLTVRIYPARHYSGRSLTGGKSLWAAFVLESPERKLFFSGDSGYGQHFAEIGAREGGFDLAVLDSGQYGDNWPYIHMTPEEASRAVEDLGAGAFFPAHAGKFSLAFHAWDEPFIRAAEAAQGKGYRLVTPLIGQVVNLEDSAQIFSPWWKDVR